MSFALLSQSAPADDKAAVRSALAEILSDSAVTRIGVRPGGQPPVAPSSAQDADAFLAQVIAGLMVLERLDIEVAYLPAEATPATRRYGLPSGPRADDLAAHGSAVEVPLIRDDAATVLVGRARHLGADAAPLHGETYVDSDRLFDGETRAVVIEPMPSGAGVRARIERRLPGGWLTGRAVQTGGTNLVVEREGILTPRVVKRSTFYRHHIDLRLVRP